MPSFPIACSAGCRVQASSSPGAPSRSARCSRASSSRRSVRVRPSSCSPASSWRSHSAARRRKACGLSRDSTSRRSDAPPLRRNRDFVLLQVGQTLSTIGSESTGIAYPLLVLALTHSPVEAGIAGFARIVPWALFGFLAGAAVDRLRRKRMMIVSDLVRIAAVTSIVVAIALDRISFAQIAIVAFVEGTMYVFFNVAEIGALRSVVPARQLPAAAAAEQARYSTVTLVAPPLGGSLFGLGRALPFLADAVSYVFSLASLLAIRTPFQEEREPEQVPLRTQLAEGFRWLWGHRFLRTCALLFTWANLVYEG